MLSCILLLMYFQNGFELFVWSPWVMVIDVFGFTHTSPICFFDEFVVCQVVCFLSFLIIFSSMVLRKRKARVPMLL